MTDEKPHQRRAEIAEAARALIAERGFEGLRTRDIAERVGINIATLHYHVPTKDSLIEIVAQSLRDDFIAQNIARPRAGKTAWQRLMDEFEDFRDILVNNPDLFIVFSELLMRAKRDPRVAAATGPMQAFWHAQWVDLIEAARVEGSLRGDIDPFAAATMIIGALVASQRMPGDRLVHFERVVAELERSITSNASQVREPSK